jgi:hypothetical protein
MAKMIRYEIIYKYKGFKGACFVGTKYDEFETLEKFYSWLESKQGGTVISCTKLTN